jgi:hypothetical protein
MHWPLVIAMVATGLGIINRGFANRHIFLERDPVVGKGSLYFLLILNTYFFYEKI